MMTRTKLVIGTGATALVLSACGGVAATAGQPAHHQVSPLSAHQKQTDTSATYVEDVAKAKRDLMRGLAQRAGSR